MKKEIWKDVPNYEGIYQVSNLGRIKSLKYNKERILSQNAIDNCGYIRVGLTLCGKTKIYALHQLVAMAFLNHKPDGHKLVVDHIDNDKLNNRLDNLQIITQRENTSKDRSGKTSKYTGVSWSKERKKWVAQVNINNKTIGLGRFNSEIEASNAYQEAIKDAEHNIKKFVLQLIKKK